MKKLFLIRHCKADNIDSNIKDFDKKLNKKGLKEAVALNKWFNVNNMRIDQIIVSSAIRTMETAKSIFHNQHDKIKEKKSLYLCSKNEIIKEIKMLNDNFLDVVLIGHEPSISESLRFLTVNFRPDISHTSFSPYPTGGLAIIYFNIKRWVEIDEKTGTLDAFITPSYLQENE